MEQEKSLPHLRIFLYGVCKLLKDGESENISCIEKQMNSGIASYLYKKYTATFDSYDFSTDLIDSINEYYKNQVSYPAGNENRKYDCQESDGLWLILMLALDEIH